jgi:hypothetical protein
VVVVLVLGHTQEEEVAELVMVRILVVVVQVAVAFMGCLICQPYS